MSETSVGQVKEYFTLMSKYFEDCAAYYQSPTGEPPLFMELLSDIKYYQVLTESLNLTKSQPSMVSGALIESASSALATLREAGMRSKTRSDFFAEAEADAGLDSKFYLEHGQLLLSYINGRNDAQN